MKPLYERLLNRVLESYEQENISNLKAVAPTSDFKIPYSAVLIVRLEEQLVRRITEVENIDIRKPNINIRDMIEDYYKSDLTCFKEDIYKLTEKENQEIKKLEEEKKNIIKRCRSDLDKLVQDNLKKVNPYKEKHKLIQERRPELEDIFRLYMINIDEYKVNPEELSLEEIDELFDLANYGINSVLYDKKFTNKICQLLYLPLVIDLKDETMNLIFLIVYFISTILVCLFCKPVLAFISVMYLINVFSNVTRVIQRKQLLQAAYAISEDIDFEIFVKDTDEIIEARRELEKATKHDLTSQIEEIHKKYNSQRDSMEDPNDNLESELTRATVALSDGVIDNSVNSVYTKCIKFKEKILNEYHSRLDKVREILRQLPKTTLGDDIANTDLFSPILRVGAVYSDCQPVSEVEVEIPFGSIGFIYKDDSTRSSVLSYLKLVLANFLCDVNPKQLIVDIYDEVGLGGELAEFLTSNTLDYVRCKTQNFDKLFEEIKQQLETNINKFGISDIQKYNKEAMELEKTTMKYRLLVIISGVKIEDNPALRDFIISKQKQGLIVLFLYKDSNCFKDDAKIALEDLYSKVMICREYGRIISSDRIAYGGVEEPAQRYEYTREIGEKVMTTYSRLLEERKDPIVLYKERYQEKVIPRERFWTYNTLMGIEARFGFVDGDPTKAEYHVFGDNTPHALVVGRTGAGKSVFLNNCLANMMLMYPPEWLSLVMVDFKNTEFFIFQGDFAIPQAKVVAGTTDGEYAKSIFKYLDDEMARRNEHFLAFGCKNIIEYNKKIMGGGVKDIYNEEKDKWYRAVIMPRILFVADEFQVMFNKVDSKSLREIEMYIISLSKVARSAGCHLLFASQSMAGTMSADILNQFKLRIALACDEKLSCDILGNPASSKIDRMGYSYTNDSGGTNPNANKYWRTPFIATDVFKAYIKELNEKCEKEHINKRTYRIFNETEQFGRELLDEWLNDEVIGKDPDLFVLGEPTFFSVNKYPPNFRLFKENSENIIFGTYDTSALLNGINTLIANIQAKENTEIIINCTDKDIATLLNAESKITPKYKSFLNNEIMDLDLIFELMEEVIDKRVNEPDEEYPRIYFFGIGWDKMEGLGEGMRIATETRMKKLLDRGPKYGVHFIIANKDISEFKVFKKNILHRIGSKLDSNSAKLVEDNDKLTDKDFMSHIAIYSTDETEVKFKLYKFPVEGELKSRELKYENYD